MHRLDIRPATVAEVDDILALWQAAAENDSRPADTRAGVVLLLERDPAALLVAVDATGIVGSVVAGWDGWRAHLYRLAVRTDSRGRGVGRSLVTAAAPLAAHA